MRVYLRNDQASKVLSRIPANYYTKSRGVLIQVLGGGTVWFDTDRAQLENTDSTGTPTAGSSITSASGVVFFEQWLDDMWARASATGTALEVTPLGVK